MPSLKQSLQGQDLGHLRIVAELWGLEYYAPDERIGLLRLVDLMLSREMVEEVIAALPGKAREALFELVENGGRISWSFFTRQFGAVREMGIAQRDRALPYEGNPTITEVLWYRGLLAHNFFNTPSGPEEFAYIPDDLLALLPPTGEKTKPGLGRLAYPIEQNIIVLAVDKILDEACTLLALLRMGAKVPTSTFRKLDNEIDEYFRPSPQVLRWILTVAGLLDENGNPIPEPTRFFLEANRGDSLVHLVRAWLNNQEFNELRLLPGLIVEGEWKNDPLRARQAILGFLSSVPGYPEGISDESGEYPFWSLNSFVEAIHQSYPDYQRSAGDYDSWYLKDEATGEYLRGFQHWYEVDGEVIRYMITGPLHWLGIMDLALSEEGGSVTSFRFSKWAKDLLNLIPPKELDNEQDKLFVCSDGRMSASYSVPRVVRYQVARFCQPEGTSLDDFRFRMTPDSLKAAKRQGLRVPHLLTLLRHHAKDVPPSLVKALKRWEAHGSEFRINQSIILQSKDPETMKILQASKASRFLGESLGPTAVIVKEGAQEKVLAILIELGFLGDFE